MIELSKGNKSRIGVGQLKTRKHFRAVVLIVIQSLWECWRASQFIWFFFYCFLGSGSRRLFFWTDALSPQIFLKDNSVLFINRFNQPFEALKSVSSIFSAKDNAFSWIIVPVRGILFAIAWLQKSFTASSNREFFTGLNFFDSTGLFA